MEDLGVSIIRDERPNLVEVSVSDVVSVCDSVKTYVTYKKPASLPRFNTERRRAPTARLFLDVSKNDPVLHGCCQ